MEYYSAIEDPVHELYVRKLQGLIDASQAHFAAPKEVNKRMDSEEITLEQVFKISDESDY